MPRSDALLALQRQVRGRVQFTNSDRLFFMASANSISAPVRYSRVRTEEFTVVGVMPLFATFSTTSLPSWKATSESVGTVYCSRLQACQPAKHNQSAKTPSKRQENPECERQVHCCSVMPLMRCDGYTMRLNLSRASIVNVYSWTETSAPPHKFRRERWRAPSCFYLGRGTEKERRYVAEHLRSSR